MKNKIIVILSMLLTGCSMPDSKQLKILAVMPTASPSVFKSPVKAGEIRNGERYFKAIHIPE